MKKILLAYLAICLVSCKPSKTIYVNEQGDTIASITKNPDFRYTYLLTDKEYDDTYLTFLFEEMNMNKDAQYIAVRKAQNCTWTSYPQEEYTGYRSFLYSNNMKILHFSTVEEEKAQRERVEATTEQLWEDAENGVRNYYGNSMDPVTEYCYAHFNGYTAYNSSDITKHGSSYYVRHIFKAENEYGATVEYDLMFRINEYGQVINTWDFNDFTQNPSLRPSDFN